MRRLAVLLLLSACTSFRPDIQIVTREKTMNCRPLGAVAEHGASPKGAVADAQDAARDMGGNTVVIDTISRNPGLPGDMAILTIGMQYTAFGQAFYCPPAVTRRPEDPALTEFIQIKLPAALREKGRDPDRFIKIEMQRLISIAMPADRQMLFLSFLAHRAKNGPQILMIIVDTPLDQVQAIARLDDDALVRVLEHMDAGLTLQQPLSFEDALLRTKKL